MVGMSKSSPPEPLTRQPAVEKTDERLRMESPTNHLYVSRPLPEQTVASRPTDHGSTPPCAPQPFIGIRLKIYILGITVSPTPIESARRIQGQGGTAMDPPSCSVVIAPQEPVAAHALSQSVPNSHPEHNGKIMITWSRRLYTGCTDKNIKIGSAAYQSPQKWDRRFIYCYICYYILL